MNVKHRLVLSAVAAALGVVASAAPAVASTDALRRAHTGTLAYHNVGVAKADGYAELKDAAGIACIDDPVLGGMGVHYVKGDLIADPAENAATPEALVYEPQPDGRLKLVALEYIVLRSTWEGAGNTAPPALFGHPFELTRSPNRFGLPPFYELHAWIWERNPAGKFHDFNPRVSCAAA